MSLEKITGLIRHALTFGGGFLVAMGYTDETTVADVATNVSVIIGAVTSVIGAVWSIKAKFDAGQ